MAETNIKVYKIKCYSFSYSDSLFARHIQSVIVIADSKETALFKCKEWLIANDNFIYEEDTNKWEITCISENVDSGVIDYFEDSDYSSC